MLRGILEDNRRERELRNIVGRCVKYSQFPKLVCNEVTLTKDGIVLEYQKMDMKDNKYVRYEAYYCQSYVLIKDVSTGMHYYVYGKYISNDRLFLIIHDILATGSNISLILENDENNSTMKKIIMKTKPNFGGLLFKHTLYSVVSYRRGDINYENAITYDVNCNVDIYKYMVEDGDYSFENILKVPGIGRLYKIMSKYLSHLIQ